jgi:hypothetical protein
MHHWQIVLITIVVDSGHILHPEVPPEVPLEVRKDLRFVLEGKRDAIMNRFACFVLSLCTHVKESGVSVENFRTWLLQLPAFASDHHDTLLSGVRAEMRKADTINKLFDLIGEGYTSFLNYGILDSILSKYCKDVDCEDLKYPEHLEAYINEHNVTEFGLVHPQLVKISTTSEKLCFKFDIEKTRKIGKVLELGPQIAKILKVLPSALQLFSVEEGCIIVTYLIPVFVAEKVFTEGKMTMEQWAAFRALSVQWVKRGDSMLEISTNENGESASI